MWHDTINFSAFDFLMFTINIQGFRQTFVLQTNRKDNAFCVSFAYMNTTDFKVREWIVQFETAGRYLINVKTLMSFERQAFSEMSNVVVVENIYGCKWLS